MTKKGKGNPLASMGIVCYAEQKKQLLQFTSMGQMVQFYTLEFFKNFIASTMRTAIFFATNNKLRHAKTIEANEKLFFLSTICCTIWCELLFLSI